MHWAVALSLLRRVNCPAMACMRTQGRMWTRV